MWNGPSRYTVPCAPLTRHSSGCGGAASADVATSASNSAARNPRICRALMADPRILQFTGIDQDVQPVLRRWQRAGGKRVHRTRRIVGLEIGRASCRERVCQYVLLRVVAESLTKTKPKKH